MSPEVPGRQTEAIAGIEATRAAATSPAASDPAGFAGSFAHLDHRELRSKRITWAWGSSILSKIATACVQLICVPIVYRTLGQSGYAAFAAVTSSAGLISFLDLGIGGSLVTPLAEAVAKSDRKRQAALVQGGLLPLLIGCIAGALVILPTVGLLPLTTLFGTIGKTEPSHLRLAAIIAASATLATIPLFSVTFLRQAYQEIHITNLIGAVSNALLCVLLLVASAHFSTIAVYVGLFIGVPLAGLTANYVLLFARRRFLLRKTERLGEECRHLLGDGVHFLGASFSNALIYQWPVYWVARNLPASQSSAFAICVQAIIFPLGTVVGLLQPLWSATADARSRGDYHWLRLHTQKWRNWILASGLCACLVLLCLGKQLFHIWLRKPFPMGLSLRAFLGLYILLSVSEQFYFALAMGFGRLRQATAAIFQRSIAFALAVPFLSRIGGPEALWCGLCVSILAWTSWRLPRLLSIPDADGSHKE